MTQETMKRHGAFSWNELMTSDVAAAKSFYADLFGWQMSDQKMDNGMIYTIVKAGDKEVAGMLATPPDANTAAPAWGSYVTVDNVDAQVKQAEQLGGRTVLPPTDIPDVGRFAVISDPQGAMLSLITYAC